MESDPILVQTIINHHQTCFIASMNLQKRNVYLEKSANQQLQQQTLENCLQWY